MAAADLSVRSRAWNDRKVTAHHAIIPTPRAAPPSSLTPEERAVYDIIARRYLAQFFPNFEYHQLEAHLLVAGERFTAKGREPLDAGLETRRRRPLRRRCHAAAMTTRVRRTRSTIIPALVAGQVIRAAKTRTVEKKTKAPPRFTSATLVRAMTGIARFVSESADQAAPAGDGRHWYAGDPGGDHPDPVRSQVHRGEETAGLLDIHRSRAHRGTSRRCHSAGHDSSMGERAPEDQRWRGFPGALPRRGLRPAGAARGQCEGSRKAGPPEGRAAPMSSSRLRRRVTSHEWGSTADSGPAAATLNAAIPRTMRRPPMARRRRRRSSTESSGQDQLQQTGDVVMRRVGPRQSPTSTDPLRRTVQPSRGRAVRPGSSSFAWRPR